MSRTRPASGRTRGWEWLARLGIAGMLLAVAACGRNEPPPPPTPNQPPPTVALDATRSMPAEMPSKDALNELGAYPPARTLTVTPGGAPAPIASPAPHGEAREHLLSITNGVRLESDDATAKHAREFYALQRQSTAGRDVAQRARGAHRGKADLAKRRALANAPADAQRAGDAKGEGKVLAEALDEAPAAENYQPILDNPYKTVKQDPLSTFSIGVDTASYSNVRRFLNENRLPPKDAVRIAELINYFPYAYASPRGDDPVAFTLEIGPCPWQPKHHLLRIALKAKTIDKDKMPPRNLVFLIDTSGSMQPENRLPLVKRSLHLLVDQLTANDRVSIVTYAGNAGLALAPTPGDQKDAIIRVIDGLGAGGSTNGAGGLMAAYEQAKLSFIKEGVNRVILATDGDFNVGVSSDAELVRLIEERRNTGVYLTALGYGMGNLKDSKLEQIARHGNGHYAYIDSIEEAKKVFVEQGGALVTVAKDVKLQVEFNPAKVAAYRLVGYENRLLNAEDFRDDKKDAGDMGSGHTCTALYEIVPEGEKVASSEVEPLKYQTPAKLSDAAKSGEFMTVRMRYKHPETDKASEVASVLPAKALGEELSKDFQFAAAVASFGLVLRDSDYKGNANFMNILESGQAAVGEDKEGHRKEFVKLARLALTIDQAKAAPGGAPPAGAGQP